MNKANLLLAVLTLLIIPVVVSSQITITEIKPEREELVVLKPEPYDSLQNWKDFDRVNEYKKYIGIQVYYPPFYAQNFISSSPTSIPVNPTHGLYEFEGIGSTSTKKNFERITTFYYKPIHYKSDGNSGDKNIAYVKSNKDEIGNKYYTIVNVLYGDTLKDIWKKNYNALVTSKDYTIQKEKDFFLYPPKADFVLFQLRNDSNGDTVFCYHLSKRFILVPFFVKQKQLCEYQYFIYDKDFIPGDGDYNNQLPVLKLPDNRYVVKSEDDFGNKVESVKEVDVAPGSKWYCSEVTVLKPKYTIHYILKNDKGEQIAVSADTLLGAYGSKSLGFIKEQDYLKRNRERELQEQELINQKNQEERARIESEKRAFENHLADCISRFGPQNGDLIANGKVKIGMTTEMCKYAWGAPFWTSKTTTESGVFEDWYYGLGYSLHFINGILKVIEE